MSRSITITVSDDTAERLGRMAQLDNLSESALVRLAISQALGIEDRTNDNATHNEFSKKEVEFIIKRYGKLGPTATASELTRRFGKNRLPGTVTNRYKKALLDGDLIGSK